VARVAIPERGRAAGGHHRHCTRRDGCSFANAAHPRPRWLIRSQSQKAGKKFVVSGMGHKFALIGRVLPQVQETTLAISRRPHGGHARLFRANPSRSTTAYVLTGKELAKREETYVSARDISRLWRCPGAFRTRVATRVQCPEAL
jgi:hypothetical protein